MHIRDHLRRRPMQRALALSLVVVSFSWAVIAADSMPAPEGSFLVENEVAMARMMRAMHAATTGDVDRDFVAMMIPHHQGAIDMAHSMLRHGKNEQLKRLAQEIIVTQQQEIAAMRLIIADASGDGT